MTSLSTLPADLDPLVRLPVALDATGLSPATLYREMAAGRFPKSVVIGPNTRAWRLSEIKAGIAERVAARDKGTDAEARLLNPNIGRGRRAAAQHAA